ncbi:MAG: MFS transporter [Dehalococcoidia bacterium]|nr:MFS transporter [Dehalococcoidia bacterium]
MLTNRWLFIVIVFLIRTTFSFQFQAVGSVSSFLRDDLLISHAQVGTLIGIYMLPGVAIALPGGFFIKYFGDRRMAGYGLSLMVVGGIVFGLSDTYALAIAGRLVSGIGAVLINVAMTKIVTDRFAGREIRTALAIMVSSWPFGIALGLVGQGAMADALSWQAVMFLTSAISAVGLAALLLMVRVPQATTAPVASARLLSLSRPELVLASLAGLAWAAYNVGFVMFVSFGPDALVARGIARVDSDALVSIGVWVTMFSIPLGGYLAEKIGRPQITIMMFASLLAVTIGVFPYLAIPAILSMLFGAMIGPPTGPLVALPSDGLRPENRGPGLGVYYTWSYAAKAIGPAVAGAGRNITGSASTPLFIGAGLFASTVLFVVLFQLFAARHRNIVQS